MLNLNTEVGNSGHVSDDMTDEGLIAVQREEGM